MLQTLSPNAVAWINLLIAGGFEIATTTMYRYTAGLTRVTPTIAFFALGILSFFFLNRALASIPIGTAYAAWTGMGAAGTVLIGIAFYSEPATAVRLALLTVLIGAIVGLKLVSAD